MKGIKECLEIVKGVELIGVTAQEVLADGKINGEDLDSGVKLITSANVLVEAVKGLGEADDELKDLDDAEMIQLGSAVFSAIKAIKAAKK
jgi:hypothetical protein